MKFVNATRFALTIFALSGCEFQRAQKAEAAKASMVGMTKEQVLTCMGPPAQKSAEGMTEVWSYSSGNGEIDTRASAATAASEQRFCIVNVVLHNGAVSAINYNGPTGGPLTAGEQCAYAIENCVR
jgi:outer membrane protein assembly factor BamE (lipoprotein component of BamABCDE complex)